MQRLHRMTIPLNLYLINNVFIDFKMFSHDNSYIGNAQVTFVEQPQLKIRYFQNQALPSLLEGHYPVALRGVLKK